MQATLTQAQSVRARKNWKRLKERYFQRSAGEFDAGSSSVETVNSNKRFDEQHNYGTGKNFADQLTGGSVAEQELCVALARADVSGPTNDDRSVPFSVARETMQNYLSDLRDAINDKEHARSDMTANFDKFVMKDLVVLANRKRPDLNAHLVIGSKEFGRKVKDLTEQGNESFRIIARESGGSVHFVAFDVNNEGWRPSVIAMEPVVVGPNRENDLAPRCGESLKEALPDAAFLIIECEIQRATGACGMFSLFLAKTMFKEQDELKEIHGDNVVDRFEPLQGMISGDWLSPRFMKHAQSRKRVSEYFSKNRDRYYERVNKRGGADNEGEVLAERYVRHWGSWSVGAGGQRDFSRSIEVKRVAEYQALLDAIDDKNRHQE